jgi:predicted metal-dependent phosphoesterase TrpH
VSRAVYDLHLHSCWSYDATAEVASCFRRARELALRCIAITDHHVLDSLPEVLDAARSARDVIALPSAELTVTASVGAVDLLCYGFPLDLPVGLVRVLETYRDWQRRTGSAICRAAQALGYEFTDVHRLELLETYRPARALKVQGATHVKDERLRQYFVDRGFIADASEYPAFKARLRRSAVFPPYPPVDTVVPALQALGVLVAIAHPHGYFAQGDRRRMDALRAECRLDGIECAHHAVPPEFTPYYRAYCVEHGLFSTGGSDCHDDPALEAQMAVHAGAAQWLDELLDRIGPRAVPPAVRSARVP